MLEIMNFNSLVIMLLVITFQVLPFSIGRVLLHWRYSNIIASTLFTTLIVGYITFSYFSRLKLDGLILTVITPVFLATFFVFMFINIKSKSRCEKNEIVIGYVYWIILAVIFSIAIFKSWDISSSVEETYLLKSEQLDLFIILCGIFLISGAVSMYMFFYEWKMFCEKKGR